MNITSLAGKFFLPVMMLLVLVLTLTGVAWAQTGRPLPAQDSPTQSAVPAGHNLAVRSENLSGATTCQSVKLPPVTSKMRRYSHIRYALYFIDTACTTAALLLILWTGLSAYMRDFACARCSNRFVQLLIYYGLFLFVLSLMLLPLSYYQGYWLEHSYGLSRESLGRWLSDLGKSKLVELAINVPVYCFAFWLIGKKPNSWATWLWIASIPAIAASIFLEPLVLDPLFNQFTPLPASHLRSQIQVLAARAGIPRAPIFVVDKSKQTQKMNAYVTGIGSSARIVIWDNTLKGMPEDQVLAVLGHEMGHYVLLHVCEGFAISIAVLLVLYLLAQKLAPWAISIMPRRWGIEKQTDMTIIPFVTLAVCLIGFLAAPVDNWISRWMEHEADAYGLRVTGNGPAMARTFVTLSQQNLSEPDPPPFIEFWLFSHPSLKERIEFAQSKQGAKGFCGFKG